MSEQIPLKVRVSPDNYRWLQEKADAMGISMTAYVDRRLSQERAEQEQAEGASARPDWWRDPVPGDQATLALDSDEEARLKSA